jgi:protein-tyrosine phosphatase
MATEPSDVSTNLASTDDRLSPAVMDSLVMGEVEPGLWVGGLGAVKEIRKRPGRPWTVVSAIKAEKLSLFLQKTFAEIRQTHPDMVIEHISWDIADRSQSDLLSDRLDEILTQIDARILDGSGSCLIHCAFGISRSVSICAAWLISRRKMTMSAALQHIRAVRPDAFPNMGFIASLRALEQSDGDVQAAQKRLRNRRT